MRFMHRAWGPSMLLCQLKLMSMPIYVFLFDPGIQNRWNSRQTATSAPCRSHILGQLEQQSFHNEYMRMTRDCTAAARAQDQASS
ncbi:hypothetical protein EDC04DRAFT_2720513 [Pisolithus marmoratus]|nr:hypothetical protein EDC04DRAFT_2720513 [Pisolithus marmoratus]